MPAVLFDCESPNAHYHNYMIDTAQRKIQLYNEIRILNEHVALGMFFATKIQRFQKYERVDFQKVLSKICKTKHMSPPPFNVQNPPSHLSDLK